MGIRDLRIQYETAGLDRADLLDDAVEMLKRWYSEAESAGAVEPNAMVVSTVDSDGAPDSRVVLARGISSDGVTFFTNRLSAKGLQISHHPRAAALFVWLQLHRQVRVRGTVHQLDDAASDAYFASRPRESQIGAWASPQSRELTDRGELEDRFAAATATHEGRDVPRPPHWGGYVMSIDSIEFWQGRANRLHDRFLYTRDGDTWSIVRLAP